MEIVPVYVPVAVPAHKPILWVHITPTMNGHGVLYIHVILTASPNVVFRDGKPSPNAKDRTELFERLLRNSRLIQTNEVITNV